MVEQNQEVAHETLYVLPEGNQPIDYEIHIKRKNGISFRGVVAITATTICASLFVAFFKHVF